MGADPRLPKMPDEADADRFLQAALRRRSTTCCRARARAQPGCPRRPCSPASCTTSASSASFAATMDAGARRLIEPYVDEEELGDPHAPGAALLPGRSRGRQSRTCTRSISGRTTSRSPTIVAEYERARSTSGTARRGRFASTTSIRSIPNAKVSLDDFTDIIGRHFKQPKEGLGCGRHALLAHVAHAGVADAIFVIETMIVSRTPLGSPPPCGEGLGVGVPRSFRGRQPTQLPPSPPLPLKGGGSRAAPRPLLWHHRRAHSVCGDENRRRHPSRPFRTRPAEFVYRPLGAEAQSRAADAGPGAIRQRRDLAAHGACGVSCARRTRMRAYVHRHRYREEGPGGDRGRHRCRSGQGDHALGWRSTHLKGIKSAPQHAIAVERACWQAKRSAPSLRAPVPKPRMPANSSRSRTRNSPQ